MAIFAAFHPILHGNLIQHQPMHRWQETQNKQALQTICSSTLGKEEEQQFEAICCFPQFYLFYFPLE